MKKVRHSENLQVVLIGNFADYFVHHTISFLDGHQVRYIFCDDIYSAIGKLTLNNVEEAVIIGRLELLNKSNGRFLSRMKEKAFTCCCFVEDKGREMYAGADLGVILVNEPAQLVDVLLELLSYELDKMSEEKSKADDFNKEEYLVTKSEIDALLGAEAEIN